MADLVQFELNQPVEVALKFPEPRMIETKFGEERAMYTLTDERVMFLDPLTAAKIRSLGVTPGDCFHIVKRKKGRAHEYDVFRDSEEPTPRVKTPIAISEEVTRAAQQPIESHPVKKLAKAPDLSKLIDPRKFAGNGNLEHTLEQSIAQATGPERKPAGQATAAVPAWQQVLIHQTNTLVDAFAECLQTASRHGLTVKPEDVRSLLVTSFIQLSQKGGRHAA